MRISRLIFVFLMAMAAVKAGAQKSFADAPHVHVELVKGYEKLTPSASGIDRHALGLYFKLEKGWHIYWKNAGDAGEPPKINWTMPEGVSAEELGFPAPKRLPIGPLMDYGYEDEVIFPIKIVGESPTGIGGVPYTLKAHITWIVCSDSCIPGKADLQTDFEWIPFNTYDPETSRLQELLKKTEENLPKALQSNSKAIFAPTANGFLLSVEAGQRETSAVFFPSEPNLIDNPAPQKLTPTAKGFQLELKRDQYLKATPAQLPGLIELGGGRNFEFVAVPGKVALASSFHFGELLRVAGLAFLGGILLNLMPCVFPVLFLKGLALLNSRNEERGRLRAHGAVYAAGIVVSFWALVGLLLILRGAGATLGWGFQFQSPVFLSLMAGLLFFLGLSLAGQFEIGLTLTSAGGALAQKQGFAGSFFTGVLAVVVATPCAAPFMGVAVGYALAQSAVVTFVIFTALALGLAAPYVALTLQPAWTRVLPKPGVWMEILKQATAVPIFGTAIWLVWVVASTYGTGVLLELLVCFLLLAVAGWFLGRWPAKRWATIMAALILAGVVVLSLFAPKRLADTVASAQATSAGSSSDWQPWSAEAVAKARADGKPVFVDFTAKWCLSCQVNERVALEKPEVREAFEKAHVVKFKADWTQHDDAIANELSSLGRNGVPVYALYKPGASEPELLPEALTPGIVLDALGKISK
jgi:DsbC/DsbD-like thiol-disulfide interchange protein/cytochrome c biogenesis protein CcdA/thiol-disulfide isomerase/thioredoxin